MQATVHASISQWLQWHGPVSAALPAGTAASPSAQQMPSAYPAALLWCSPAVISTGSFVIVLQVASPLLQRMLWCVLHIPSSRQRQIALMPLTVMESMK